MHQVGRRYCQKASNEQKSDDVNYTKSLTSSTKKHITTSVAGATPIPRYCHNADRTPRWLISHTGKTIGYLNIWISRLGRNEKQRNHGINLSWRLTNSQFCQSDFFAKLGERPTPVEHPPPSLNSWQDDTWFVSLCCCEDKEHQSNETGAMVTVVRWKRNILAHTHKPSPIPVVGMMCMYGRICSKGTRHDGNTYENSGKFGNEASLH